MKELEDYLWSLTVSDLAHHKKKLGIVGCKDIKSDMIGRIMEFYKEPEWLEKYFETLSGFDKAYAELIVHQNFRPIAEDVRMLIFKYDVDVDWYGEIEDNLKFVIKHYVPDIFRDRLKKLVPPIEVKFDEVKSLDDIVFIFENNNNSMAKFDNFLAFISKYKIKASLKNNYVSKSNIIKFLKEYDVPEIPVNYDFSLDEARTQRDTVVVNGIVTLLMSAKIIDVKDGYFTLGSCYLDYVNKTAIDKAKLLLNSYIDSSYNVINEVDRLTNYIFRLESPVDFKTPRLSILEYVRQLPIDKWVLVSQLKYYQRLHNKDFLRPYLGNIEMKNEYYNFYHEPSYDNFEEVFVDVVLRDYLAVLGIVDVGVMACQSEIEVRDYLENEYVKLTLFGAMVLDLKEPPKVGVKVEPLVVTEDLEIIIYDGARRMEYELYFARFLKEKVKNVEMTIFQLDFKALAKAYEQNISLMAYIVAECPEIPDSVLEKFVLWGKTLGEVTIKKVYILEAKKEIMQELMKDGKIKKFEQKDVGSHIIVQNDKIKDLKIAIEKKEYFCDIDD